MRPAGPSKWSVWISRHREIRRLTRWYVLPSTTESRRRCWVVRALLLLGPTAAVLGGATLILGATFAASPPAIVGAALLVPVVLAGGFWRSSTSLTVAGCMLTLSGIAVLWKGLVPDWPRIPVGAALFGCAFLLAVVAIFQALREPAVATWVDNDVTTDGLARRHNG